MKVVSVKYLVGSEVDRAKITRGLIIESIDDLAAVKERIYGAANTAAEKMVKSGVQPNRYDHVISGFRPIEKAISHLACLNANLLEDNPLFYLRGARDNYLQGITDWLEKSKGPIFVGRNGGYCPVEGTVEVVEEHASGEENLKPYIRAKSKYDRLASATKVINLENDCELERNATDFMESFLKDRYYSHIKELRLFSDRQLKDAFEKFKEAGGEIVYVYTTGRDNAQMYKYSELAMQAGLTNFAFQFSAGIDDDIIKFIEWLKKRATVKVYEIKNDYRKVSEKDILIDWL